LQGPPGTGKTTLVAWLVREILADDPVGQILVTAQAHGAVDVLREMVRREAFAGVPEHEQPLAVRLGGTQRRVDDDITTLIPARDEASVEGVSLRVLELARDALPSEGERTALQAEWGAAADEMAQALRTASTEAGAPDFCELVKRGAHITYCTTSAGELEELADMTQSFDWSILEEAGKAHSFDLALPLQAGHRWLLIGDHHPLPPYRFDHYWRAIENLPATVAALRALPSGGAGLVDYDWIRSWEDSDELARAEFARYVSAWLNTFARIFDQCHGVIPAESTELTDGVATAPAAGMITGQHRMHPDIGELISEAYYRGELRNETVDQDGRPLSRVCHPFVAPAGIANCAVTWLDLPWAARGGEEERGPRTDGTPRYTNPAEVDALGRFLAQLRREGAEPLDLAVLSPYNRQVGLINQRLPSTPPAGLRLKQTRRRRGGEDTARVGHTVDSFQGNQAEVIAVSLVRNNTLPPGDGLGFLREAPRVNVLLSRAERLLVLVGSFEFFQEQVRLVSLQDPFDPLWHWKKVVSMLERWFEEGRALRLPATSLP
ncbi:MAG: AAA domain-containing protein, partial [Solirubrobacterales bacterium]